MRIAKLTLLTLLVVATAGAGRIAAIPALQLYIEGSTYDPITETWVVAQPQFTLWVIGNVGHYRTIYDVKLAAAVKSNENGTISLTPTTASLLVDPSTPPIPIPTSNFPSSDGAIPKLSDGLNLPPHGIYGPGVKFYEWSLGGFTLTDSPIGDFSNGFPTEFPKWGQINVYIVQVSGFSWVHFDTYGYIIKQNPGERPVFAPFSHDAEYKLEPSSTPEPSSLILLLAGGAILLRMRRRQPRA